MNFRTLLLFSIEGQTFDRFYLTGYRPLFGTSDCWSKVQNPILNMWFKKLLAAFFDPKQAFFYFLQPLEVPNPDKMSKVITNLYESRVLLLLSLFPFILMAVKLKKNKSKNDKSEIIWLPKK